MSEKKPNLITIDEVEYDFNDLTAEQKILFEHCIDLDRKINNTKFQLDQLQVGKQGFYNMLKQALEAPVEKAEVEVVQ